MAKLILNPNVPQDIKFSGKTVDKIRALAEDNPYRKELERIENTIFFTYKSNEPITSAYNDLILMNSENQIEDLCYKYERFREREELNNQKIIIIDAIMGAGKTSFIIDSIITNLFDDSKRFICVLPTLDECKRYKEATNDCITFFEPDVKKGKGSKLNDFKDLLKQNKNIATTHALIKLIDDEVMEYINRNDYTLIIDEELNVVEQYKDISQKDLATLYKSEYLKVNENGFLWWNDTDSEDAFRYDDVKRLCNLNCLMQYYDKKDILIWNFPTTFFNLFKKCYICTYNWNGSMQKSYFDLHNIKYSHQTLLDGSLTEYNRDYEYQIKTKLKNLINIYEGNLNKIGEPITIRRPSRPLSSTWFKKSNKEYEADKKEKDNIEKYAKESKNKNYKSQDNYIKAKRKCDNNNFGTLSNNTYNFFRNIVNAKSNNIMWTCFNDYADAIRKTPFGNKKKGSNFVPCNCKGTNDFKDRYNLAYLIDFNISPVLLNFFKSNNVSLNEDLYSLNAMLQWIWRSAIREMKPINIYIPSQRMRTLLIKWLNNEI